MPEIHKIKVQNTEYDIYDSRFGTSATPTIPQTQADWKQETDTASDFIKNKPAIWDSEDYTVPEGATYGDSDTKAIGAVALNLNTNQAKGDYSVSEGYHNEGNRDVVINGVTTTLPDGASGFASHAEGSASIASGIASHAEGRSTTASGFGSHAEGGETIASGTSSHAEGTSTEAFGEYSHAEGYYTTASGYASHVEGINTISQRKSQHVFGEFNIADSTGSTTNRGNYVEIVGNGNYNTRSNARTLDWDGNEVLAGKLTVGATPTANMDVTTKEYVDNAISNVGGLTATVSNQTLILTM